MSNEYDAIKAVLDAAASSPDLSPDDHLTLLNRVMVIVRDRQRSANLAKFGSQFVPAGEPVEEPAQPRQFQPFQQVYTHEGYLGYIAGHDKRGKAVVNVVWEAAEYDESKLLAIPGPSVLDAMTT